MLPVMGPDIVACPEAIDATLAPLNGRGLMHGGIDCVGDDHKATDVFSREN